MPEELSINIYIRQIKEYIKEIIKESPAGGVVEFGVLNLEKVYRGLNKEVSKIISTAEETTGITPEKVGASIKSVPYVFPKDYLGIGETSFEGLKKITAGSVSGIYEEVTREPLKFAALYGTGRFAGIVYRGIKYRGTAFKKDLEVAGIITKDIKRSERIAKVAGTAGKATFVTIGGVQIAAGALTSKDLEEASGRTATTLLEFGVFGKGFTKTRTLDIAREPILISPKLPAETKIPRLTPVLETQEIIDITGKKVMKNIQEAFYIDESLLMGSRPIIKARTWTSPFKKKIIYEGKVGDIKGYEKAEKFLKYKGYTPKQIKGLLKVYKPQRIQYELRSEDLTKPVIDVETYFGEFINKPIVSFRGAVISKKDVFLADLRLGIKTRGGKAKVDYIDTLGELEGAKGDIEIAKLSTKQQTALLRAGKIPYTPAKAYPKNYREFQQLTGIKLLRDINIRKGFASRGSLRFNIAIETPAELYAEETFLQQVFPRKSKIFGRGGRVIVGQETKPPVIITKDLRETSGIVLKDIIPPRIKERIKSIKDYSQKDVRRLMDTFRRVYGKTETGMLREPSVKLSGLSAATISSVRIRPPSAKVSKQINLDKISSVYISSPKEMSIDKIAVVRKPAFREMNLLKEKDLLKEDSLNKLKNLSRTIEIPRTQERLREQVKQTSRLLQKQEQKLKSITRQVFKKIPRIPTINPPRIFRFRATPKIPRQPEKKYRRSSLLSEKAFEVFVIEKKKPKVIGRGLSEMAALDIGTRAVAKSLRATFGIRESLMPVEKKISTFGEFKRYKNLFREPALKSPYKKLGRVYVQKKTRVGRLGGRLAFLGEIEAIQKSRKLKMEKYLR